MESNNRKNWKKIPKSNFVRLLELREKQIEKVKDFVVRFRSPEGDIFEGKLGDADNFDKLKEYF